jgi:uncharacterized protein (DUF4415 family)
MKSELTSDRTSSVETTLQSACPTGTGKAAHHQNKALVDVTAQCEANNGVERQPRTLGQRGKQKRPTKILVTMRFSPEVLNYFKADGEGWQTRINDTLMEYVELQGSNKVSVPENTYPSM